MLFLDCIFQKSDPVLDPTPIWALTSNFYPSDRKGKIDPILKIKRSIEVRVIWDPKFENSIKLWSDFDQIRPSPPVKMPNWKKTESNTYRNSFFKFHEVNPMSDPTPILIPDRKFDPSEWTKRIQHTKSSSEPKSGSDQKSNRSFQISDQKSPLLINLHRRGSWIQAFPLQKSNNFFSNGKI